MLVIRRRDRLRAAARRPLPRGARPPRGHARGDALRAGAARPAIVASAMTVVLALLTLLLARVGSSEALGPLSAAGVFLAMVFSLTLLPATLLIAGRRAFWPRIPRAGATRPTRSTGRWGRLGARVRRRPRPVWLGGTAALLVLALGLTQLDLGLAEGEQFVGESTRSRAPRCSPARASPGAAADRCRSWSPTPAGPAAVAGGARRTPAVARVGEPERGEPGARLGHRPASIPTALPHSRSCRGAAGGARGRPRRPRRRLARGGLRHARGRRAGQPGRHARGARVVLLILLVLLRAVVLPLLLIATVIVSFAAAFGVGVLASDLVFGFAGDRDHAAADRLRLPRRPRRGLQHLPRRPGARGGRARDGRRHAPRARLHRRGDHQRRHRPRRHLQHPRPHPVRRARRSSA